MVNLGRLKLIAIFCQVVESGSMRKASQELGMTGPAVSQFINQLEAELKVTLLYRSTRRISLSEAGQKYYSEGKKVMIAAKNADNMISEINDALTGELRMSAPVGFAGEPLAKVLRDLLETNPELRASVLAGDRNIDPIAERLDIAINVGKPSDSNYIYHHIGKMQLKLVASPEYIGRYGRPSHPSNLDSHRWLGILNPEERGGPKEIEFSHPVQTSVTFDPKSQMVFNDMNVMIENAVQGLGVALAPALEIKSKLNSGLLVQLLPDWTCNDLEVFALTVDKNIPNKVRTLLDKLKTSLAESS